MRAQTKGKHGMGKRSAVVVAAVLAMIVSVVGWATAGTVGAQTPSCLPTSDRTPGPHAFAGLGIKRRAAVYTDALQFADSYLNYPSAPHEADALNSEGFVSGIWQFYLSRHHRVNAGAWATTVQLGSPEQAQAELNRKLDLSPGKGFHFTVAAIPASRGWRHGCVHGCVESKVFFTDGDYSYAINRGDHSRAGVTKQRLASRGTRRVTNAAINLYNRVHGAAVCP